MIYSRLYVGLYYGVEAGLCYNMDSVTAKPEWDITLLSNCGCNYLRIALTLYPESHTSHKCFHIRG